MKKKWICIALSSVFASQTVLAKGSVEASQLQIVALNNSIHCNRTFFQGSSHFPNTIFVMPRVLQSAGPDNNRSVEIIPSADNNFLMFVRLFFPAKDSQVRSGTTSSAEKDEEACNFDEVRNAINAKISDPGLAVKTIAPLPLTSVEVSIPGVEASAILGVSDDNQTDILDYLGKTLTFVFRINQNEKDFIESQIVQNEGISTQVKMRFQARSRDGSVNVSVNSSKLQANFIAQANGKVYMTDAEVEIALKASMDSSAVSIVAEAGSSENSQATINKMVDKILNEVSVSGMNGEKKKKKKSKDSEESDDNDKKDENDSKDKDSEESSDDSSADVTSSDSADKEKNKKSKDGKIQVKAVLEAIAQIAKISFSYDQIGAPESATGQTEVILHANRIQEVGSHEVAVQAGYQDPNAGVSIKAGQSISLSPELTYMEKIEYKAQKTFLDLSQISELNLEQYFEEISNPSMSLWSTTVNGIPMAEGRWYVLGVATPGTYRWLRVKKIPVRTRYGTQMYGRSWKDLKQVPVSVSFTAIGEKYKLQLSQLVQDNSWWSAKYDSVSGRIILTAKKDLGRLTFSDSMTGKENIDFADVVSDEIIMQKQSALGGISNYKTYQLESDQRAIIKQRTVLMRLSRPVSEANQIDSVQTSKDPNELGGNIIFKKASP